MPEREHQDIASITKQQLIQLSSSLCDVDTNSSTFVLPTSSNIEGPSTPQWPPKKQLFNDYFALSLDVEKLSDRKATAVLTTIQQGVGSHPSIYNVNHSSVHRQRINFRQKIATSLKGGFKAEVPLAIHCDGKMIEYINGHKTVDRLPIIVYSKGINQVLVVPKVPCRTRDPAASIV